MNIDGIPTRTLRAHLDQRAIDIIDQTRLPHALHWVRVDTLEGAAHAIRAMQVRGAPLIGATAAYGLAIALSEGADDERLQTAIGMLWETRPTAVNLHWALTRMSDHLTPLPPAERQQAAWREAEAIAEEDIAQNLAIGQHGLGLLRQLERRDGRTLNIMTHCNAGWLATVDAGTALSPVYAAYDAGLPIHVWVSETRPRNQGLLTAWELAQHGVPHTLIADNAAGILLREGKVDAVIVGADRIAANGDVANKVGTYLKALACADNSIPFYVAAPRSTIDFDLPEGKAIRIEERDGDEFRLVHGLDARGVPSALHQLPAKEAVANPAFDVTPARLVTAIITERGPCPASREGLLGLYPEEAGHG
jgi:methylthioribose-1-phosphate isomerase